MTSACTTIKHPLGNGAQNNSPRFQDNATCTLRDIFQTLSCALLSRIIQHKLSLCIILPCAFLSMTVDGLYLFFPLFFKSYFKKIKYYYYYVLHLELWKCSSIFSLKSYYTTVSSYRPVSFLHKHFSAGLSITVDILFLFRGSTRYWNPSSLKAFLDNISLSHGIYAPYHWKLYPQKF